MRVLFTGASSFTGTWFVRALRAAGHEVLATVGAGGAEGVRAARLELLRECGVHWLPGCRFGDDRFIAALGEGVDAVCHHGAEVTGYRSLDFDIHGAVRSNTLHARQVLLAAAEAGARAFIVTGSVFEPDEGLGETPLRAFSPYGLSKGLSWQVWRYWSEALDRPVHKFVIPNPFGPYEEPRFCAYLMQRWAAGETARVGTPAYVRDNIPVSLLAAAYADFVARCGTGTAAARRAPSGYIETQGDFAQRFAREIGSRLGIATPLELAVQTEFAEPLVRVNPERREAFPVAWDESRAWDETAAYYRQCHLEPRA